MFDDIIYSIYSAIKHDKDPSVTPEKRALGEPMNYTDLVQQICAFYLNFYIIYLVAKV